MNTQKTISADKVRQAEMVLDLLTDEYGLPIMDITTDERARLERAYEILLENAYEILADYDEEAKAMRLNAMLYALNEAYENAKA
jgi:putative methionine-R-sulfoxide reductase with GAF domain